jgi:hypothetical protein
MVVVLKAEVQQLLIQAAVAKVRSLLTAGQVVQEL